MRINTGYLWYNVALGKTFPAILPFEKEALKVLATKKGKSVDFSIGEFWVDDSQKLAIILDYVLPQKTCTFYDDQHLECEIYDSRPTICRMFPITSLRAIDVPEVKCAIDVVNCPSTIEIFGKSKEKHDKVVCPSGHTFSSIFGLQLQDAAMMDFYMDSANLFINSLRKLGQVGLKSFRPNRVSRILARYEKLDFELLFKDLEGKDFRSILKPLFLEKVRDNSTEANVKDFTGVDVDVVSSWIGKYW